jgi:hypothetical protein
MIDEQRLIYVRSILLQAEIEMQAMIAENKIREAEGKSLAYDEEAFMNLIEKYGLCGRCKCENKN